MTTYYKCATGDNTQVAVDFKRDHVYIAIIDNGLRGSVLLAPSTVQALINQLTRKDTVPIEADPKFHGYPTEQRP